MRDDHYFNHLLRSGVVWPVTLALIGRLDPIPYASKSADGGLGGSTGLFTGKLLAGAIEIALR
jgi:hypothetical protein